jgi:hypothetical protein
MSNGDFPAGRGEEQAEHGGLGQAADPGLDAGDLPGPVACGDGACPGGVDPGATVGLGERNAGNGAGQDGREPPVAGLGSGVVGDELAVAQSGGVAQVDVVVAAGELQEHLKARRVTVPAVPGGNREGQETAGGQALADLPQVQAAGLRVKAVSTGYSASSPVRALSNRAILARSSAPSPGIAC